MASDLEERVRAAFREKLQLLSLPEREDDFLPPACCLLEKRRELAEVEQAYLAQKEEFQMKMENLQLRRQELEQKEEQLKKAILKFDKFLKENDAKRNRALKKAEEEQQETARRGEEVERLREEVAQLLTMKEKLQRRLEAHKAFPEYLQKILEKTEQFQEIPELIGRFQTLLTTQDALVQRELVGREAVEEEQARLQQYVEESSNQILQQNNHMAELQAQLEQAQAKTLEWSSSWACIQNTAATNTLELGQIKLAVLNLFQMVAKHKRLPADLSEDDTEAQLDAILVVGCGNSELSEQLYDEGYQDIVNVDISEVVIKQMQERSAHLRPKMSYLVMDVLQMDFPDERYQVVLDKGTLDALLPDEEEATLDRAQRMFSEIGRVLQFGGRYLCVSLAQAHVLKAAMDYFFQEGWMIRIHQLSSNKGDTSEGQFALPIFVYVMTRIRHVPGSALRILELCAEKQDKPVRFSSIEHLTEAVKERQQYALLCSQLNKNPSAGTISLDLCNKDTGQARYTLHVVHNLAVKMSRDNQFAIFIIPQGRETEWLFGTEEGRKQLAASAGFRRLVTVALHREQHYESMGAIQAELSEKVMELAPPDLSAHQQVPFLSVGGDIGIRTIQHRDTSTLSGEYVVEDVKGDDAHYFRRLIFLSNRNVVQSEARLASRTPHKGNKKHKKKKKTASGDPVKPTAVPANHSIDESYLCCAHHRAMVAGLCLLKNPECLPEALIRVLVIGLGGGSLPLFIHDYFLQSCIDVVEIDPAVLDVATRWFGFSPGDRLKVHIADGLVYVSSLAAEAPNTYDAIMFDVDSKDSALGMSCPPAAFVEKTFLQKVRTLLKSEGIFILNLVCRDSLLRDDVLTTLRKTFPLLYARRIEGEVNEILFCQQQTKHKLSSVDLRGTAQILEKALRQPGRAWDSTYVLADMLEAVRLV